MICTQKTTGNPLIHKHTEHRYNISVVYFQPAGEICYKFYDTPVLGQG